MSSICLDWKQFKSEPRRRIFIRDTLYVLYHFASLLLGKPFAVRNCTLANQTYTSVEVKCVAGYDGGLPQQFILEVYQGDIDASKRPLYNLSTNDEPFFALSGLEASVEAGIYVAVFGVNAKGRSQPVILSEVTFRDAEKRTGE